MCRQCRRLELAGQRGDLTHGSVARQALAIKDRHAGGVVATVFEAFQSFQQDLLDVAQGNGGHNATHNSSPELTHPCAQTVNRLQWNMNTSF
ncbi:hypothetical protein [Halomonas sp. CUBES01]|uniref:hypothetical protein n=1 Tax=Halomonas sp. CUBES01 TaxID=2897340 RepID=UPI003FA3D61D